MLRAVVGARYPRITFDEYIDLEEISGVKHEFLDGLAWAMSGGTPSHARITMNIGVLLGSQLRDQRCAVFSPELRIRVRATGLATYPDITVICGVIELDPEDRKQHTALNPKLIVEVLSPSTETYDRGEKVEHYKQIKSLEEVVLVAHDERRLEIWRREGERWTLDLVRNDGVAELCSVDCELPLSEIYRDPLSP